MIATEVLRDSYTGPSDQEVVLALQRMASGRAQLLAAERAESTSVDTSTHRNDEIEEAHADLLWRLAQSLTSARRARSPRSRSLEAAEAREQAVLTRFGYESFRHYLDDRTSAPTTDVHLVLARREYDDAQASWERLLEEMDAGLPTVVIDLTGDDPRTIL
jgi:hypothetical protein